LNSCTSYFCVLEKIIVFQTEMFIIIIATGFM